MESPGSRAQIKHDESLVLQDTSELRLEDYKARSGSAQPLEFLDRGNAIRRRSPILPVSFEEGYGLPSNGKLTSKHFMVNQDENSPRRNQCHNFLRRQVNIPPYHIQGTNVVVQNDQAPNMALL
jgi:hypothetical protein